MEISKEWTAEERLSLAGYLANEIIKELRRQRNPIVLLHCAYQIVLLASETKEFLNDELNKKQMLDGIPKELVS